MPRDLRSFIEEMGKVSEDWCLEIPQLIQPEKFEAAALAENMASVGKEKALLFTNVTDLAGEKTEFSLIMNLFAQRSFMAVALDLPPDQCHMELTEKFSQLSREQGEVVIIPASEAPCREVVRTAGEVDLRRFPVPMFHEKDAGPYFTMVNVMKSRKGNFYDISFCKNQIYDAGLMSSSANLRFNIRHLARIISEHKEINQPAPVILVIGHHPAFYLGSQASTPYGNNDYLTVAGFLYEALRLTPSVTWGDDFLVPADAEIIIEGEILPEVSRKQNPFGEFSGHYQAERLAPVIGVKAVTHRRDAILQSIFPAHPDHFNIGCVPRDGSIYRALQQAVPGVTAVHLPSWGCSRFSCIVALKKESAADVQKAAMTVFSILEDCKFVIAVDPDINVFNHHEVWWAVVTQARFETDLTVIPNAQSFRSWLGSSVAIIDATRPNDLDFPERCKVPAEVLAKMTL